MRLRLRPPVPAVCTVYYSAKGQWLDAPMRPCAYTARSVYFQVELEGLPGEVHYYFKARLPGGQEYYLGSDGIAHATPVAPFAYSWTPEQVFYTPEWAREAVFYQIFPDRFANGDSSNDPEEVEPWGAKPTRKSFFGGDLEGIRRNLDYLKELGITAIWLNPIFAASSNHRYDTRDYLEIDPFLGDKRVFRRLLKELHEADIRLVLDGVFNHTGADFWAFKDIKKKGAQSPYLEWYYVYDLPVRTEPQPSYNCWWGFAELPKLRETNPLVRRYLLGVAQYWTDYGIDGWRLDVPNEIKGNFWVEFRKKVRDVNPEAYLVGEIWGDGRPWLKGDQFDAVMNYRFRDLVLNFFVREKIDLVTFDRLLGFMRLRHAEQVNRCQLNLLGSHDTARIYTEVARALGPHPEEKDILSRLRLLAVFQMTYVGAPMIYYGDELGLEGEEDPDCRRCMPWSDRASRAPLFQLYRRLIALRKRSPTLKAGTFDTVLLNPHLRLYGYARRWRNDYHLVLLNASPHPRSVEIPVDKPIPHFEVLSGTYYPCRNGRVSVTLEPFGSVILEPSVWG